MNMHHMIKPAFRPIQYLGNKTRLVEDIASAIASIVEPGRPVADLFSGTSVVGKRLSQRNPVVAVDVQAYADILGRAMLMAEQKDFLGFDAAKFLNRAERFAGRLTRIFAPLIRQEAAALDALSRGDPAPMSDIIEAGSAHLIASGDLSGLPMAVSDLVTEGGKAAADATASLIFGGVYFSYEQAIWLDAVHTAAQEEPERRRWVIVAAMLGAASEAVNTVGKQFAQPIRLLDGQGNGKQLLITRTLRDRSIAILPAFMILIERWRATLPSTSTPNRVVAQPVDTFIASDPGWEAAYADPPYTIDHYSRFYHVLETLIRRDSPTPSRMRKKGVPTIMRGLYREDRYQSGFCIPSKAPGAFDDLFRGVAGRGVPLVLSYSGHTDIEGQRARTISLDELASIAGRHFRWVDVLEPRFEGHRKLNATSRNAATESGSERLFICRT